MPEIPQLPEKGFPVKVKQAVNALNKRTRKLDEFTADEPLRLRVSDANMKLTMSEDALQLLKLLSQLEDSGIIEQLLNGRSAIGNATVTAEYWDSASSTVKTATFVVQV